VAIALGITVVSRPSHACVCVLCVCVFSYLVFAFQMRLWWTRWLKRPRHWWTQLAPTARHKASPQRNLTNACRRWLCLAVVPSPLAATATAMRTAAVTIRRPPTVTAATEARCRARRWRVPSTVRRAPHSQSQGLVLGRQAHAAAWLGLARPCQVLLGATHRHRPTTGVTAR